MSITGLLALPSQVAFSIASRIGTTAWRPIRPRRWCHARRIVPLASVIITAGPPTRSCHESLAYEEGASLVDGSASEREDTEPSQDLLTETHGSSRPVGSRS